MDKKTVWFTITIIVLGSFLIYAWVLMNEQQSEFGLYETVEGVDIKFNANTKKIMIECDPNEVEIVTDEVNNQMIIKELK